MLPILTEPLAVSRVVRAMLWTVQAVAVTGCALSQTGPTPTVLTGVWGGDHISMTVTETSSHLEFDCARGDIPGGLTADSTGAFVASGMFVREHGGPVREDERPDAHPAAYVGTVTGNTMQLMVRLTDPDALVGSFTLTRDAPGRVFKCL